MQKRMMLIVNPKAGKGGYRSSLTQVLEVFCSNGFLPSVYFTKRTGNGAELVRRYAQNYDLVVCLGGDGTLSEIVGGMMLQEERRPIGYIPLGTANDVARTLGLSGKPHEAAKQIVTGKPIIYDVGEFGSGNFFTYVAAFGAFTEVSYATPQEYKQMLGHMAYMLEAIKSLSRLTDYRAIVEYDGGVIEDNFIFGAVTNTTSVAGLVRLDNNIVDLADGMFEILLVRKPQDMADLREILTSAVSSDFSGPNILFLKSREVRIMFPKPVAWTRDGEDGGLHRDVYIVNRHPGVQIIV